MRTIKTVMTGCQSHFDDCPSGFKTQIQDWGEIYWKDTILYPATRGWVELYIHLNTSMKFGANLFAQYLFHHPPCFCFWETELLYLPNSWLTISLLKNSGTVSSEISAKSLPNTGCMCNETQLGENICSLQTTTDMVHTVGAINTLTSICHPQWSNVSVYYHFVFPLPVAQKVLLLYKVFQ